MCVKGEQDKARRLQRRLALKSNISATTESRATFITNTLAPFCIRKRTGQNRTQPGVTHNVEQESSFIGDEVQPNLWKPHIYKEHFKSDPHPDDVKPVQVGSQTILGVLLPDDGSPLPIGR